jgi:hypothetical protein
MFIPSTPDHPPPTDMFLPSTPDLSLAIDSGFNRSSSVIETVDSDEVEEEKKYIKLAAIRQICIDIVGGEDNWDNIVEPAYSSVLAEATRYYNEQQILKE